MVENLTLRFTELLKRCFSRIKKWKRKEQLRILRILRSQGKESHEKNTNTKILYNFTNEGVEMVAEIAERRND